MSDGYEIAELGRIETALDALVSPTSEDVFQATRPFDERAIASVAATRGGNGGSQPAVSCFVEATVLDIHAVANHPAKWSGLLDDPYDANPIGAIPAGLGLTFLFDGSSATITTTTAGVWALSATVALPAPDATIRGYLKEDWASSTAPFGPNDTGGASLTPVYALPSGAVGGFSIETTTGATANPYNVAVFLEIVRLG